MCHYVKDRKSISSNLAIMFLKGTMTKGDSTRSALDQFLNLLIICRIESFVVNLTIVFKRL